jgi:chemotaxis response regulator CheB
MTYVFLISRCPLFSQGLESLLCGEPGLAIVGRQTELEEALEQIRVFQPDVVILDDSDPERDPKLAVLRILQCCMDTRVIRLSLMDNIICIYQAEQRVITEVTDLVDVITGRALGAELSSRDQHPLLTCTSTKSGVTRKPNMTASSASGNSYPQRFERKPADE